METTVGYQRFTANGNLLPTTTDYGFRVYSVHAVSTLSASHLALHNALVSGTNTQYLKCNSDEKGVIDYEWTEGKYFDDNVYLVTGTDITFALVGYSRVTA